MENKELIDQLNRKLDLLLEKSQGFAKEIDELRVEIFRLRFAKSDSPAKPEIESTTPIIPKEKEEYVELVERKVNPQDRLIHKKDVLSKERKGKKKKLKEKTGSQIFSIRI